jgi:hypothetical protein
LDSTNETLVGTALQRNVSITAGKSGGCQKSKNLV